MKNITKFVTKVMIIIGVVGMLSVASESDINPNMSFTSILIKAALSIALVIVGYLGNELIKKECK